MKSDSKAVSTDSWILVESVQTGLQELAQFVAESLQKRAVVSIWKHGHGASQQIIPNKNANLTTASMQALEKWLNDAIIPPPGASTGSHVTAYPTWVQTKDHQGSWTGFCLSGPEVEDYWGILFWDESPKNAPASFQRCLDLERLAPMLNAYRLLQRKTRELELSDQKHQETEKALRDSEAFYHSLVETLPQNIFRKDLQGRFTFVNDSFCDSLEQSRESLIGKTDFDFFPLNLAQKYGKDDERVIRSGKPYDTVEAHHTKSGDSYVQVSKTPLYDANGEVVGIQGIFWDVTERKKVEEALAYERDLLRALLDYMPDSLYFKDKESRFIRVSKSLANRLGLKSPKQAEGKTDFDFFDAKHAQPAFDAEQRIVETGQPVLGIVENEVTRDGKKSYVLTNKVPFRDKHGAIIGTFGISKDITDLIEAEHELKRARDYALQSAQMKSEFVANMSHEIRTPMNGVIGITELLLETELDQTQRDFSETIRASAESLLRLISDILDFSKLEAGKQTFENIGFTLREVIEEVTELLANRAQAKGVELISWVDLDIPDRLVGDPTRIRQVLLNLVGNAIKFTEKGEVALLVYLNPDSAGLNTICFEVKDTGIGIPIKKQNRLFNAFVQADSSTTRKYGGSGLGLVISKQLAEGMGGDITFESREGAGSTFRLNLTLRTESPAKSKEAQPELTPQISEISSLHLAAVLVSNESLRKYLSSYLEAMSVKTVQLHSKSALENLWNQDASASELSSVPNLIIMDVDDLTADPMDQSWIIDFAQKFVESKVQIIGLTSLEKYLHQGRMKSTPNLHCFPKPIRWRRLAGFMNQILNPETGDKTAPSAEIDSSLKTESVQGLDYSAYSREIQREDSENTPYSSSKLGEISLDLDSLDILVAEDNPVNQMVTTGQLEQLGHRCQLAMNGKEALAALERQKFDMMFMDCHMPVMDGYETTQTIRDKEKEKPSTRRLPIVALTANAMEEDRQKCLSVGMDYYLSKPTRREQLKHLLDYFQSEGHFPDSDYHADEDLLTHPTGFQKPETIIDSEKSGLPMVSAPALTTTTDPTGEPAPPTLNPGPLKTFANAGNPFSLKLAYQLVETYERDASKNIEALAQAIQEMDTTRIKKLSHTLKGSSRNIGAERMGELAEHLEENTSTEPDTIKIQDTMREIHAELDQVKMRLQQLKSTFPALEDG